MIEVSISDQVFIKEVADELEEKFSDMYGRLVENEPGEFKAACFQAAYNLNLKLSVNQFAVYKMCRERFFESLPLTLDVIEEYNAFNAVFIMGINEASARIKKLMKDSKP